MRYSLALSCLLLAGWTQPAGNFVAPEPADHSTTFSTVPKSTETSGEARFGPAETTGQLTEFDEPVVASIETPIKESTIRNDEPIPNSDSDFAASGDALASLDAVSDGFTLSLAEQVPIPPRRAVPHTEVCEALASAAANNDLPVPFLIRLIWQESGFDQNAVSRVGAQGVAQFMPETAARRGLDDPFNPLQAVRASARFLRDLVEQFGNIGFAAAAYNAGPGRVQAWLSKRAKLPQETRNYVERITGLKPEQWKGRTAAAQVRVPPRAPCQREAGLYSADGPEHIPLPPTQAKAEAEVTAAKPALKTVAAKTAEAAKVTRTAETKTVTKTVSAKTVSAKTVSAKTVSAKTVSKSDKKTAAAKPAQAVASHKVAQTPAKPAAAKGHRKVKVANAGGES